MKQKEEKLEVIRGSGNIFHDFGHGDGELRHLKCQLAAEIIGVLDENGWSVRQAQKETGFDAGDFSRIRNADFKGITLDKMVRMLEKLNLRKLVIRYFLGIATLSQRISTRRLALPRTTMR